MEAAASIYGTHLVTDQPDTPHLAAAKTKAEIYFACAEHDIYAPPEMIEQVQQDEGLENEVEVYPGTQHGFAFPTRPVYHREHRAALGAPVGAYRRNLVS